MQAATASAAYFCWWGNQQCVKSGLQRNGVSPWYAGSPNYGNATISSWVEHVSAGRPKRMDVYQTTTLLQRLYPPYPYGVRWETGSQFISTEGKYTCVNLDVYAITVNCGVRISGQTP